MSHTRVDFYVLESNEPSLLFACRFLEKAYLKGHRVFVFCQTRDMAEQLDEQLWTFKEDSFIPHNLQGEGPEPPPPIQIGYGSEPRGFNDVLLNLSDETPSFVSRFKRVIELVANHEEAKAISRAHYKFYRNAQFEVHSHVVK